MPTDDVLHQLPYPQAGTHPPEALLAEVLQPRAFLRWLRTRPDLQHPCNSLRSVTWLAWYLRDALGLAESPPIWYILVTLGGKELVLEEWAGTFALMTESGWRGNALAAQIQVGCILSNLAADARERASDG